jgi:hypothetical protein
MSIQILPLSTPLPDNYIVNQNTITADWYSGDDAFKNGTYIISSSSYSTGYDAYKLVDGNDNTYWSSGVVNSTNNIENVKYTKLTPEQQEHVLNGIYVYTNLCASNDFSAPQEKCNIKKGKYPDNKSFMEKDYTKL